MTVAVQPLPTYRALLAVREFRLLYLAHVVSVLGDVVAVVALTILVFERTGSPLLSALTFSVLFTPQLAGVVLVAAVVDRVSPRTALVACHLVSAALAAVMALPGLPVWALLALLLALGVVAPVFSGVRAAILPDVLPERSDYVLGRALLRATGQAAQLGGNVVGAGLLLVLRPQAALLVDAASFALSALFVAAGTRGRRAVGRAPETARGSAGRGEHGGVRAVLAHRDMRRLLLLLWALPACLVAPEALAAPYAADLGLPGGAVGLLLAGIPAGRSPRTSSVPAGCARPCSCACCSRQRSSVAGRSSASARPPLAVTLVLLALAGLGFAFLLPLDRLILETAPVPLRSRVLAIQGPGLMVAQGVAFTAWGAVGSVLPVRVALPLAGTIALLSATALRPRRPSPPDH